MRILVVGAGAVGGYYGARLVQAGRDVTFLVRPAKAARLRRDGLRIASPHGDATLAPRLVTADALEGIYDLVLLSVKGYALDDAIEDFAPAVGPETMILPVLNGMRHMDTLTHRFGLGNVIGGVAVVATTVESDDRIRQIAEIQLLRYGELDGTLTDRIRAVDEAMRGTGIDAASSTDIIQAMWEKWVQLASLGAVTCLLRGPVGAVAAVPGGADVARAILGECAAVAAACGHRPSDGFLERQEGALTAAGSPQTSSMYRDLRAGAAVEVDTILGDLLDHARAHGVSVPLLQAAFVNLRVYRDSRVHAPTP
ncbi:2-dehydropantoate 2-reductase [Azospirillum canadense]|uniref:2-dehydropantoate 2-reductase n=1 Tax=Azospirillum canadense TaxID=403962 RepID=UPI0022262F96|nr:2-dehydropantoate 2-reductase [Azospirillum canadense]MCW2238732.1 2-dehydropantoate 2-reductase [Azospirillum canadense]